MQSIVTLLALYMFQKCNSRTINGATIDPDIVVKLTDQGINEITADNYWKMSSLRDWGLEMILDSHEYSFQIGQESKLMIQMDAFNGTAQSDAFYAFSVGDEYMSFTHDLDGRLWVIPGSEEGLFIYPSCGTSLFPSGDASQLITGSSSAATFDALRDGLAEGDAANWERITAGRNRNNFPVTFEFINDDISNTFTFRFISNAFSTPLECVYNSAMATGQDFKFYLAPDAGGEILFVKSFEVYGEYLGTDCGFCGASADAEPLNVTTIVWSAAISIILSLVTVFISHLICMNHKTNTKIEVYDKVNVDTDYASS